MLRTTRTQLRRIPERGTQDAEDIWNILHEGLIASIGFSVDGQPYVIPTLYGCDRGKLYLHGSAASRMMRELEAGAQACVTVTLVDGIVLARSAFHHSMNYRSVVAFGSAKKISDDQQQLHALQVISEHVMPGRWADVRGPTERELKATTVLEFTIDEASAKVRTGPPSDDDADYDLPVWAGVVPMAMSAGVPIADPKLRGNVEVPEYASHYLRRRGSASRTTK